MDLFPFEVAMNTRLHFFFTAQGIADDQQKCSLLLIAVCEQTFDLLPTLVQPKALEDCKYAELCRLFAQKQLDLAMALSLVEAYEAARKDVECIRTRQPDEIPIDRMQITRSPAPQRPGNGVFAGRLNCSLCADTRHDSRQCPFKNARCAYCRRIGHIQRACHQKQSKHERQLQQQSRRNVRAYVLSDDGEVSNAETARSEQVAHLFNTHEESTPITPPTMVTLLVNGTRLSMEIGSGASSSIISEETFLRVLHGRPKLQRVTTVLRT
ncbi:hypothetical protein M513_07923 [Trichuris suis]|uniref:CCHC-type domain-containing protein n=1 Tax=Trichuris suis TaxID=68888 RepID=A0A085M1R3_9BILA|nr:hypothetical protein M513_07923 [Trichuris suis]